MKTELIIFERPYRAGVTPNITYDYATERSGTDGSTPPGKSPVTAQTILKQNLSTANGSNYAYARPGNENTTYDKAYQTITRPGGTRNNGLGLTVDLYDSISIPITYTILDVREPEKRKTSWSKTVTIPGTKNNNRIFSHIYEIGQDGWVTIGDTSVWQGFNPNMKKDIVLLNDGIQILRGNLQLKSIKKDKDGNIEYSVALSGDLTALFYDIGKTKLDELDWSEWDHSWTRENVKKSWGGITRRNREDYNSISNSQDRVVDRIDISSTGSNRLQLTTTTAQGYAVGDWVIVELTGVNSSGVDANTVKRTIGAAAWYIDQNTQEFGYGCEYQIMERISSTQFTVNTHYPSALPRTGVQLTTVVVANAVRKRTATGKGYCYPMVSWGEEADNQGGGGDTWGVTDMVPAYYVKEIWDKVMEKTGSRYESDFLDSQIFKRLVLIQKKKTYDLNPAEFASRQFNVGLTGSYWTGCSYVAPGTIKGVNFINSNTGTPQSGKTYATASLINGLTNPRVSVMPLAAEEPYQGLTGPFYDKGHTSENSVGNWDENTYKWIVRDDGEYNVKFNCRIDVQLRMNGYAESPWSFNGTTDFSPSGSKIYYPNQGARLEVYFKIFRKRAGNIEEIDAKHLVDFNPNQQSAWSSTGANPNWASFGTYQPPSWINKSVQIDVGSKYFSENDEVWVEVWYKVLGGVITPATSGANRYAVYGFLERENPGNPPPNNVPIFTPIVGEYLLKIHDLAFLANNPNKSSVEGGIIEARSFLPKDMTCRDFLLGVIKMFNLHIEQDPLKDRVYYIEPRDDYYKDGSNSTDFVDWTDKMDNSSVDMRPLGELIAKYYEFSNKKESDYWNKKFLEERGRNYMTYTKEINNEFLKTTSKITTKFGSTVMINNPADSDVVIPAVYQQDGGSVKPLSNSAPRMLIWTGLKPFTANRGGAISQWYMKSGQNAPQSNLTTQYEYYPFAGTVDSPTDPVYDLNWYNMEDGDFVYWDSARWTNGNLYNRYWKNMILEISDPASKVIEVMVDLDPSDIFALDFKKIYILDGHWLRLQKVENYDPIGGGLTKCEFLKLRSPTKFKLRSDVISVYGNVSKLPFTEWDNSNGGGGVITDTVERVPEVRKPNVGYNNYAPGAEIGTSTVQLNGQSNHVSASAKNINISGDENNIGNDTRNVVLSGSNGNRIVGGVKNVNMIGTNKKVISESDVTYINGIRYKNGIAISKSSVINGGLDNANETHSDSTQINIINAGEDVVITAGSQTYENVINPGVDNILPDVAPLGLSTDLSPNPATNLAGGFAILSPTASMIEIVRENKRLSS